MPIVSKKVSWFNVATFTRYQKKNGDFAWRYKAYIGIDYITGKRVETTRQGFPTKKAAQANLNNLIVDFKDKKFNPSERNKKTTVSELYELWFTNYKSTVRESTWIATDYRVKKYILPVFGDLIIERIDLLTAQQQINIWSESFDMHTKLLSYLRRIMDYGVSLELIESNPFKKVLIPKKKRSVKEERYKFYKKDELKTFLNQTTKNLDRIPDKNIIHKYYGHYDVVLFHTLAYTGLRIGEALALTWNDLDPVNRVLTVNKTLSDISKGFIITKPKTRQSNRKITIDDTTINYLLNWRKIQSATYLKTGVRDCSSIFANPYGKIIPRQNIYNRSNRIADQAELHRLGNHGFRHTHASLLFEAGANFKDVQERLGHSSINITMDIYTHVTQTSKRNATDKFIEYMNDN